MNERRILFIAYFYPPLGGPAVQRPLKLIKYLDKHNYKVDVLTVKDIVSHSMDEKLYEESRAEHIFRASSYDPMAILKSLLPGKDIKENIYFNTNEKTKRLIRRLFLIDDKLAWFLPAYRLAKQQLQSIKYDYIIATIAPYTSGMIAYYLSKHTGIPLIIDYRDHWTLNTNPTNDTCINMWISRYYEKRILQHAEKVVCVGQQMKTELADFFGKELESKMLVMYNGFEESDFSSQVLKTQEKIIIRYVGLFYGHRTAKYFVQALRELLKEGHDLSNIAIEFVGNYYKETRELLTSPDLQSLISIRTQVNHDLAVELIRNSDVLLLFISNQDGKGVLTGKLFEYLRSASMILPMIPRDGEAAEILQGLGYSKLCLENDVISIKKYLLEIKDRQFNNYPRDIEACQCFSRENQAMQVIKALSEKKIKLFHLQLLPLLTGVQNVMLDMLDALDQNKYEIYVGARSGGPLIEELKRRNIHYIPLKFMYRTINPLDILAFLELFIIFKKNKFDIVHTHSSKTGLLGRIAAYLAKIKHIYHTVHGFSFHDFQKPIIRQVFMFLERFGNRFSDKVLFVNKLQMDYAIEKQLIEANKAITLYNAVHIKADFSYELHKDKLVFGSAGRFCKQKNYYNSLTSIIKVCKKFSFVEFIIIGEGNDFERCKELVKSNNMSDRIKMPGFLRERDNFFRGIDVFFLNSLWEGLPLAILEAMSFGRPILCSDHDGNLDIVDNSLGYLSKINSESDFEDKLTYIITHREELPEKALNAFKKCREKFDIHIFNQAVIALYQDQGR